MSEATNIARGRWIENLPNTGGAKSDKTLKGFYIGDILHQADIPFDIFGYS